MLVHQGGGKTIAPVHTTAVRRLMLETQVFWDDPREKNDLRVIVDVWDPAPPSAATIVYDDQIAHDDFIRAADGSSVGE
jgi:hypothetical protein